MERRKFLMNIQTRLKDILGKLLEHPTNLKGDDLADSLGITTRTLRNDMKLLNDLLIPEGAAVFATRNGYHLNIIDPDAFHRFQQNLKKQSLIENKIPQDNEERIYYLLKRLLMTNSYIKAEELVNELFISKSSLTKLLKSVKERLHSFHLSLQIRPNYGLKVEGDEMQKRACISEYFFPKRGQIPLLDQIPDFNAYFISNEIEKIEKAVHKRLYEANVNVNDIGFENIVIHLTVSIKRIQMGREIQEFHLLHEAVQDSEEYRIMERILTDLTEQFNIDFSNGEKLYLTVHLIGNRLSSYEWGAKDIDKEKEKLLLLISEMLKKMNEEMGIDVRDDLELQANLVSHLKQAITRLLLGLRIRNPLIQEIISHYPLAYEAAILAVSVLEKKLLLNINKDETGFLAIHLQAAIERKNDSRCSKRCLIICGTGQGSAVLLKYKLGDYFGELLEVVDTIGYYNWRDYCMPPNIDFIITTLSMNIDAPIPVLRVNHILGTPDFDRIQKAFFQNKNEQLLTNVIQKDLIFLQRSFLSREEVIHFLCNHVKEQGLAGDDFEQLVVERENFTETAFGNFVAIPHPMRNSSIKTFLSFCTLTKPILWGGNPVQFVCLFSVMQNNKEDLQYLYDFFYHVLNDKEKVIQLVKANSIKDFIEKLMND